MKKEDQEITLLKSDITSSKDLKEDNYKTTYPNGPEVILDYTETLSLLTNSQDRSLGR